MSILSRARTLFLHNASPAQTVVKNTAWLAAGQVVSRALRAIVVIAAARILGAASWGAFSYALSLVTFLTAFSDFGINALLTRQLVQQPQERRKYLATSLYFKIALAALFAFSLVIARDALTSIPEAASLLPILAFVFIFDTLRDLGSALARSLERMEIEAALTVITNACIAAAGIAALALFHSTYALALAYALGSALGLAATAYALRSNLRHMSASFDLSLLKPILTTAWPFGLLGILGSLALNTDIVMLGWLTGAREVGLYATAQKPIQLLYVLPALLSGSLFPLLSRLSAEKNLTRLSAVLEKSLAAAILCALPPALIGIVLAEPLIVFFFGSAYAASAPAFAILVLTLVFVYPSTILGHTIFALNKQKHFLWYVGISTAVNIAANFLLIPRFGIAGAAGATIAAQLVSNLFFWVAVKRLVHFSLAPRLATILLAGACMLAAMITAVYLNAVFPLTAAIGLLMYAAILYVRREPVLSLLIQTFKK